MLVRNLRLLAAELYKTENLAAPIIYEIFEQRNIQYNFHSQTDFQFRISKNSQMWFKGTQIS